MTEAQWQAAWRVYRTARDLGASDPKAFVEAETDDHEVVAEVLAMLEGSGGGQVKSWAPVAVPVRAGSNVGRYKVGALLNRGGMGEVYSGFDCELDRGVALKFLLPQAVGDEEATGRFVHEAKAASHLNHPNIVTIFEVVPSDSGVVIAMELVEGKALREMCGAPIEIPVVLDYGRQVALALAAAHASDIVHRDIKPENVMVRADGIVKVLDFGLARHVSGERHDSLSGMPFGTLSYMSPEQLRGESLTGASDVFSLGVVLYEMAAGRHPFEARHVWGTAHAINSQEPPAPGDVEPSVPEQLERLILAMLAKAPAVRPTSAEVVEALEMTDSEDARPSTAGRVVALPPRTSLLARLSPWARGLWRWMNGRPSFSVVRNLVVPISSFALAAALTAALRAYYGGRAPITLLSAAVFVGALYGGIIGGVLSTFLGIAVVNFVFKDTVYNLMGSQSNVIGLTVAGMIFTVIGAALPRTRR